MRYTNCVEKERSYVGGFSAIKVTAAISVFVLAAAGWHIRQATNPEDANAAYIASAQSDADTSASGEFSSAASSSSASGSALGAAVLDEIVSRYVSLQQQGIYTPEVGQKVAEKMAATLKPEIPYKQYSAADIRTDPDTTLARALAYRGDLQESLKPLLKNTQPEFEIFALYIDTKDEQHLTRLRAIAHDYRDAARASALVVAPADAVEQHVAILNAMEEFAAMLDAMATNASDPLASVVLLRTYNQAEADMLLSFKALALYYTQKNT